MTEATKGQKNRKEIRNRIESELLNYCPNQIDKLSDPIAYDFNLSPYTVRYTYLPMFINVGILKHNGNGDLIPTGTERKPLIELSDQEFKDEFDEENEQRNKLGKPPLTLKDWKKKRPKRSKPVE